MAASPPPLPGQPPGDAPRAALDALLAQHLRTIPAARLYVGDDLRRASWPGIEAAFGALLAHVAAESILAVYDDSLFGRGRKGFVVTDHHLLVVQASPGSLVRLDRIEKAMAHRDGVLLHYDEAGTALRLRLQVDEPDARAAVRAWLAAVARHNRPAVRARHAERTARQAQAREDALRQAEADAAAAWAAQEAKQDEPRRLSAHQALTRLEKMFERRRLRPAEQARLVALAAQVEAWEATAKRTGRGRKSGGS